MRFLQNKIVKGTLILTASGFIVRILGFFYRIFLADRLGASLLGTYQLIFPVYGIAFTIYGAGIQTAISQIIASSCAISGKSSSDVSQASYAKARKILFYGLGISLCLSSSLFLIVQGFAEPIASHLLLEPDCSPYLRVLSILFPFCGTGACLHGYYYGIQNARIPATTQIVEQLCRLGVVCLVLLFCPLSPEQSCLTAVWGLVAGEAGACFYVVYQFIRHQTGAGSRKQTAIRPFRHNRLLSQLISVSLTLTGTKLIVAVLNSTEAVFIPAALRMYGYSGTDALALYGILSGMVMPFLLFPSSITNSIAVMLLPAVADSKAAGHEKQVRHYITTSSLYCLLMGVFCTIFFLLFGRWIGMLCFHNAAAGAYLRILSCLCPFIYLSTTLGSVINGLGRNRQTFIITVISQSVKLCSLIFFVPRFGITAYLIGLLASQILMTTLSFLCLRPYFHRQD